MAQLITTLALLTSLVASAVARQCQNLTFPVTIEARNGVFDLETPSSNIDVINFILDLTQPGKNLSKILLIDVRQFHLQNKNIK